MSVFALSYIKIISVSVISSNFCFLPSQTGKYLDILLVTHSGTKLPQ